MTKRIQTALTLIIAAALLTVAALYLIKFIILNGIGVGLRCSPSQNRILTTKTNNYEYRECIE